MPAFALSDDKLRQFLRRKRRGNSIVTLPPMGQFLAETLEMASRLVPSHSAYLFLDDPTLRRRALGSPLTLVAAVGNGKADILGTEFPQHDGIEARVYQTGAPISRASRDKNTEDYSVLDSLVHLDSKSLAACAIRLEHAICGVLVLAQRKSKHSYSERDLQLLHLFSGYISRAILNAVDILKQNELALFDPLTGILNVRSLEPRLEIEIQNAYGTDVDVAVLFCDLDNLKPLNDRFGHQYGSEAIRRTALTLHEHLGDKGTVFRFGGDEFVVVLPKYGLPEAASLAAELLKAIEKNVRGTGLGEYDLPNMTISIGVATLRTALRQEVNRRNTQPSPASRLITVADRALYRAKHNGRAQAMTGDAQDDPG